LTEVTTTELTDEEAIGIMALRRIFTVQTPLGYRVFLAATAGGRSSGSNIPPWPGVSVISARA
jgi:hypothetical protein